VYADAGLRQAIGHCVAVETARGWRIAKEKVKHKIDVIVALAQAALGATQGGVATSWWEQPLTGPEDRMGANAAPERRRRLLDEREFELLGRGLY
jgi:hypothetical protein